MMLRVLLPAALAVLAIAVPAQAGAPAVHQQRDVVAFTSSVSIPDSSAALTRNANGAGYTLHTSGLEPGSAATNWFVVFNNPALCQDGVVGVRLCGAGDLHRAGVDASVLYATGHVIGGNGKGDFAAWLSVGDTSDALFGPGLLDSFGAEIHIVVRTHGDAVPGLVDEQTHTLNGGCLAGEPNVGQCTNVQAAPFGVPAP